MPLLDLDFHACLEKKELYLDYIMPWRSEISFDPHLKIGILYGLLLQRTIVTQFMDVRQLEIF
jgi:hypothetical protein